jgi:hypothetical protein
VQVTDPTAVRRTAGPPELESWHEAFASAGAIEPLRAVGQRLAGVLVQFLLGTDPQRHIAQARGIGREYARVCSASGIHTSQAVQAFLFYRNRFAEAVGQYANEDELERQRRYEAFMDEVLLGLVDEPVRATTMD